jgi:pimeloyl-ACP methyl ester carboxylesterase
MSNYTQIVKLLPAALLLSFSASVSAQTHSDVSFDVAVRGTGSAHIHADVYENPVPGHGQLTILAVHGFTERGNMFAPLASAIFADNNLSNRVARLIAIDLPGHGLSGFPTLPSPLLFGNLVIQDNASIVIQAIGALAAQGLAPTWIMGHSMGGLATQVAQEQLLSQGSSLAQLGITRATLIASVPALGTVWTRIPGPNLAPVVRVDPVLGTVLDIPDMFCGGSGFTTLAGTTVPGTPTAAECVANDWMAIEPINATLQLTGSLCLPNPDAPGSGPLCRPFVRAGAFAPENGTRLMVLGFSQDVLTPIVDQDELYTYLTGISAGSEDPPYLYRPTVADDAVHSMFISDPTEVVAVIRNGNQ